jgi:aryl-alcohol dehydrogenase-like predicted oxidoreductase
MSQGRASTVRLGERDVTRVGLGTNRLTNTPENVAFIREAVAAGVTFIDTAHTYRDGESERTIGAALSPPPPGCVVATKGGWDGADPETLRAEVEESLRRLQTETIGLYYLHRVDPQTPIEESVGALKELQEAGKIATVGVSNVDLDQLERARQVVAISAVQNHYSLAERTSDDLVDHCAREGIAFVAYFPLRHLDRGGKLAEIAERHGATTSQVALAWLLQRSPTLLPIPGTLSLGHLKENLAAQELELSADELAALADAG